MKMNEYQALARRTQKADLPHNGKLTEAALGLSGEAGECADYIKKGLFHGHPIDPVHIAYELGDVLWYVALMCDAFGLNMDDVADMNVTKLRNRYPQGFDEARSLNRGEGNG